MKKTQLSYLFAASALVLVVSGCSHRDDPPLTPNVNSATPTYRSQTNSDEPNNAPKFTQPGVNGGAPTTLAAIPVAKRFDQNTPLASRVFSAIQHDSAIQSRYLTVDTEGTVVRISGTASAVDAKAAVKLAGAQSGVTSVLDKIQVK